MPQSDVRKELEVLGITVVLVLQLRSHRRTTDTAKDWPLKFLHRVWADNPHHAFNSDLLPVLVDTPCQAYFQVPPDLPNLKRVDVARAFDYVWIDGLLYKLILLDFPSYLVKTISSYLTTRTFVVSFRNATSSRRFVRAGVAQGGLISCVLFTLYVNDFPTTCRHVELAQYANDTAIVATSGSTTLLLK